MLGAAELPDDAQQQLQDASGLQGDAVGLDTMAFTHTEAYSSRKIALVDGMVLVQMLTKKPATVLLVPEEGHKGKTETREEFDSVSDQTPAINTSQ